MINDIVEYLVWHIHVVSHCICIMMTEFTWLVGTIICWHDGFKYFAFLVYSFDALNGPKAADFIKVGCIMCCIFGPNIHF